MYRWIALIPLLILACGNEASPANADETGRSGGGPGPTGAPTEGVASSDLTGTYAVVGANPDGSAYEGTLTVSPLGDVHRFSWETGDAYQGIGVAGGDAVAVGWGAEECGVVLYRVEGDALVGRWATPGATTVSPERATRAGGASGDGVAGAYTVEGTNPDGTPYSGTLNVEGPGPAYGLRWEAGNSASGVGLVDGDTFGASYGSDRCGVALYRVRGSTLEGTWATASGGAPAPERATRR